LRTANRIERHGRFIVKAGAFRLNVTRYDYYAVIISAFAGAVIYLTLSGRLEDALVLTSLLSGVGLSELLRRLEP